MTKMHFEALAEALKHANPGDSQEGWDAWRASVAAVADTCARFNPRFSRNRFLSATLESR